MKRRIAIVLLLLTGGAIVNIAVACSHAFADQDGFFVVGARQYGWPLATTQSVGEASFPASLLFPRSTQPAYSTMRLTAGFIVNSIFYAAILWLLFFAPFTARRMLRRRRGQCEKCAYPIGVSPVCTECGAAVRVPARTPGI